jgi:hypothetical protein
MIETIASMTAAVRILMSAPSLMHGATCRFRRAATRASESLLSLIDHAQLGTEYKE